VKIFGVIKEVAPCSTAKTDEQLGVEVFQKEYFPYPLYLDEEQGFYKALGERSIVKDLEGTWNPIKFWNGLKDIGVRLKEKGISGANGGNGLILGGIFVINTNAQELTAVFPEQTGQEIPGDMIAAAVKEARSRAAPKLFNRV
jgi:hypothetical protein